MGPPADHKPTHHHEKARKGPPHSFQFITTQSQVSGATDNPGSGDGTASQSPIQELDIYIPPVCGEGNRTPKPTAVGDIEFQRNKNNTPAFISQVSTKRPCGGRSPPHIIVNARGQLSYEEHQQESSSTAA
jgi:hypothetical protein